MAKLSQSTTCIMIRKRVAKKEKLLEIGNLLRYVNLVIAQPTVTANSGKIGLPKL